MVTNIFGTIYTHFNHIDTIFLDHTEDEIAVNYQ